MVYENNTDAGNATVKVTGQNTYFGTKETKFVIKKASQNLKSSVDGKIVSDSEKVDLGINGIGNLTYKVETANVAAVDASGIVTAKTAGNVTVTVTADGDKNHNQAQLTVRFIFEHQYNNGVVTKEAGCEVGGEKTYTCKGCGDYYVEKIKASGHAWDAGTVTKEVTCQENGEVMYVCRNCKSEKKEEIASSGHLGDTEIRNQREATCTVDGYTGDLYCTACGQKLDAGETVKAEGHKWDDGKVTVKATCTEKGSISYTCGVCKETKTEEISTIGHQHTEIRNAIPATCEQSGYTGDTYCIDCKTKIFSGNEVAKLNHTWDRGSITKSTTCTENGIKTYTCTVCGATKSEELAAIGHGEKITKYVKKPSCNVDGYTGDIYCEKCGMLLEEGKAIARSGHSWNFGEVTKKASCTENGIRTFTCMVCGETKTETVSATEHGSTEVKNKRESSCVAEGYTGDICCVVCGTVISKGSVVGKKSHTWDGGVITQQPTVTETGIKMFTCQSCGSTCAEIIAKLEMPKAAAGKVVKDKATNGVYRVLGDGVSVVYTKPITKKATVKIPDAIRVDGVTCKVTEIAGNAFKNNKSLKTVSIGKNVTVIASNAFNGCKKLSKVNGENIVAKIGDRAFYNCSSLTSFTIPGTTRVIGKQAFGNCKKLKTIVIKTNTLTGKDIGSKAFTGTYVKVTVKVPAKQLKAYKKLLKTKGMNSKAVYKK